MTKKEAIKTLRELWRETNDLWYEEVYVMAIEALEAQNHCIICPKCGREFSEYEGRKQTNDK